MGEEVLGYWGYIQGTTEKITEEEAKDIEAVIAECQEKEDIVLSDYMNKHDSLKALYKKNKKKYNAIHDYINGELFG